MTLRQHLTSILLVRCMTSANTASWLVLVPLDLCTSERARPCPAAYLARSAREPINGILDLNDLIRGDTNVANLLLPNWSWGSKAASGILVHVISGTCTILFSRRKCENFLVAFEFDRRDKHVAQCSY